MIIENPAHIRQEAELLHSIRTNSLSKIIAQFSKQKSVKFFHTLLQDDKGQKYKITFEKVK